MPSSPPGKAKSETRYFVIDFDSTFVRDETIDVLAEISLKGNPRKDEIVKEVAAITNQGMAGKIPLSESKKRRLKLFSATKSHLKEAAEYLATRVTPSIERNRAFFAKNADSIYIVSSGFKECILPIAKSFGINSRHVIANTAKFDRKGALIGVEPSIMSEADGKGKAVRNLNLKGEVVVVGDGMNDYEIKKANPDHTFFAFTENVERKEVVKVADHVARDFDEILYHFRLPRSIYYPHGRIKVLLLEKIHPLAEARLKSAGFSVETETQALSEEELIKRIRDVAILGIRSTTQVTERVLENAPRLLTIGAFCIGTNQIDLKAASRRGIAVFNAPYSNGRSVVELAAGLILMLTRGVFDKSEALHKGEWNKSATGSHEIRGRTLGIVGYGNIGSQLSVVAEALGMNVLYFDIAERPAIGNAKRVHSLGDILEQSDFVSLHVDGRAENKNFFGAREFERMRKGSYFINLSRGHVVDIDALHSALKTGRLSGAAVDVFPVEPKGKATDFSSPLQTLPNVILTPHIGGSTEEAQEAIAKYLSGKLLSFIDTGDTALSVNFPNLGLPNIIGADRFTHLHKNVPGVLANINAVMGRHKANILGQYLGTTNEIGYVITDAKADNEEEIISELNAIPDTIRVRTLYLNP